MDFRWLQIHPDELGPPHPVAIPMPNSILWMVLQVREREGPRGEDWWGDWRDVPIVKSDYVLEIEEYGPANSAGERT